MLRVQGLLKKMNILAGSVVEPEPPLLAEALKKGAAPAPALQLKLQL